jgi:hypothetical protein
LKKNYCLIICPTPVSLEANFDKTALTWKKWEHLKELIKDGYRGKM